MPPFNTPGDVRYVRQGTSLLDIAGEKTRASAPWVIQNVLPDFRKDIFLVRKDIFPGPFHLGKRYVILVTVTE